MSAVLMTASAGFAAECTGIERTVIEGTQKNLVQAFEEKFDAGSWACAEKGGILTAVFTGKVKAGAIFPDSEKDTFFDMNYSTIEENQMTGNADTLYSKYISVMPDAVKAGSGYGNKMLLGSEKYYNIMEILERESAGSDVKAVFSIEADIAKLESADAAGLFFHSETPKEFLKFISE